MRPIRKTADIHKKILAAVLLCAVVVSSIPLPVSAAEGVLPTAIAITAPTNDKVIKIALRDTCQLTSKVTPAATANKSVTWSSSNEKVATVSENGRVKGEALGKAKIYATLDQKDAAGNTLVAEREVEIVEQKVKKVTVTAPKKNLSIGESVKLTAEISPANATVEEYKWFIDEKTEKEGSVEVLSDGTVTVLKQYEKDKKVTIKACAEELPGSKNMIVGSVELTIKPTHPKSIRLSSSMIELVLGDKEKQEIEYTLNPAENLYSSEVTCDYNKDLIKVDKLEGNKFLISVLDDSKKGKKPGTATVKFKTSNGKTDTCIVYVRKPPETITASGKKNQDNKTKTMNLTGELTLTVDILPANAGGIIDWEIEDKDKGKVTVTSGGNIIKGKNTATVRATETGTYTITAKSKDDETIRETFTVTVTKNLPKTYTFDDKNKTKSIKVGQSPVQVKASGISPAKTDIIWQSSDPEVATVSNTGKVTAVKPGVAEISLETIPPAVGKSLPVCTVTVADRYDNNTFKKALDITDDPVVTDACLYPYGNQDYYTFTLESRSDVTITLFNSPPAGELLLYDNKTIENTEVTVSENQGNKIINTTLNAGKYYIMVGSPKGSAAAEDYSPEYYKLQLVTGPESSAPQSVKISGLPADPLVSGDMVKLTATVLPGSTLNKAVTWISSDPSIATVTESGLVRVVTTEESAKVDITAITSLGAKENTCTIQVENIPATGITIGPENNLTAGIGSAISAGEDIRVGIGSTIRLEAVLTPANAGNKAVTWVSKNEQIATVSAAGVVTGRSIGLEEKEAIAEIYACTELNGQKVDSNSIQITVYKEPPASLTLSHDSVTLDLYSTLPLTARVLPGDAWDKSVKWESEDAAIVSVHNGVLYALKEGTTRITATSCAVGTLSATCDVKVRLREPDSVTVFPAGLKLKENNKKKLGALILPATASDKRLKWESDNPAVATVDKDGMVTAVTAGNAVITATTETGGKTAICQIEVYHEVGPEAISLSRKTETGSTSLSPEGEEIKVKDQLKLIAELTPAGTTEDEIIWKSSDTSVATVSGSKLEATVTGRGGGTALITATTKTGSRTAECKVTVETVPVDTIDIHYKGESLLAGINLDAGAEYQFTAAVDPVNATNPDVTWSVSNAKAAAITEEGVFLAKTAGKTTVTAEADGLKAKREILVVSDAVRPTKISIKGPGTILIGREAKLTATVSPAKCTNKQVTWVSDAPGIAKVDPESGTVTALQAGTAIITATAVLMGKDANGEDKVIKRDKKITVKPALPTSLKMTAKDVEISETETTQLVAVALPADITDKSVSWTVNKSGIVEIVSQEINTQGQAVAEIKGKAVGTVKVTATVISQADTKNKKTAKTATCKVTVVKDPTELTIEQVKDFDQKKLKIGSKYSLKVKIEPAEAARRQVTWSSSDTGVAAVSAKGVITAKGSGSAVITAQVRAANPAPGKTYATYEISVEPTAPRKITLPKTLKLGVAESKTLNAKFTPGNATKSLIWTSNYPETVQVNENGVVTGIKAGKATITAYSTEDKAVAAECVVSVELMLPKSVKITSDAAKNLYPGQTVRLTAVFSPSGTTDKDVTWLSDTPRVATVDEEGLVSLHNPGSAVIKVTTKALGADKKAKTASYRITVKPITAVMLSMTESTVTMSIGVSHQLDYKIEKPVGMEITAHTPVWKSSNTKIAWVDGNGLVTALSRGEATISLSLGGKTAKCKIIVANDATTGLTVTPLTFSMGIGEERQLKPEVKPDKADQGVSYRSSDPSVATVSVTGKVTAAGMGICKITVKSDGGNHTVICTVTVYEQPAITMVTPDEEQAEDLKVGNGGTITLKDRINSSGTAGSGEGYRYIWISSDPDIARVDDDGKVTGLSPGTATVTAATGWGDSAAFTVTVE